MVAAILQEAVGDTISDCGQPQKYTVWVTSFATRRANLKYY
jgi:hypothetical protein